LSLIIGAAILKPSEYGKEVSMREGEVVFCYLLFRGNNGPVLQGTFGTRQMAFPFTVQPGIHDHDLTFDLSTDGTLCRTRVQLHRPDEKVVTIDVEFPVNRTKVKWREFDVDEDYRLWLRAVLE
jgi:hypothetical protein